MQPKLHKKLPRAQEALAQAIVASGRMRLDAGLECNFVRILLPGVLVNQTITHRELSDAKLLARFCDRLRKLLATRNEEKDIEGVIAQYLERAKNELQKRQHIPADAELMMARALVLCNDLAVIQLLHLEEGEIYISYGHSVGDVMDVVDWQKYGSNSGMQAASMLQNAVYVSCGGHPFLEEGERNHRGDGFPALSRFMVIAAQETGHHADMLRNAAGQWVGRHSAIEWSRAPSDEAATARRRDIACCEDLYNEAQRCGLNLLVEWERHLKFYTDQKVGGMRRILAWLKARIGWLVMRFIISQRGLKSFTTLPASPYPATQLRKFFHDMHFNLSPQADVYQRPDPLEEEAVTCIEAVARVPQQVVKWGHRAVYACTPSLYGFYYRTIVPACKQAVARLAPPASGNPKR